MLKEAVVTLKFVSVKTPQATKIAPMPTNLFFIFKFFTYPNTQTNPVKIYQNQVEDKLKKGHMYYLISPDSMQKNLHQMKDMEAVLESALSEEYKIWEEQQPTFVSYLKEQMLDVHVWDADSQ